MWEIEEVLEEGKLRQVIVKSHVFAAICLGAQQNFNYIIKSHQPIGYLCGSIHMQNYDGHKFLGPIKYDNETSANKMPIDLIHFCHTSIWNQ